MHSDFLFLFDEFHLLRSRHLLDGILTRHGFLFGVKLLVVHKRHRKAHSGILSALARVVRGEAVGTLVSDT